MSEKYLQILNFKWGLEARRSELTTQMGALAVCKNGFINNGGEIEQRQSFVKDAHTYPTNTFGLQDTDTGLQTYGADPTANAALPTGVTYVQLNHPASVLGLVVAFNSVLYSTNFLGKAFVVVYFASGDVFCFYNGVIVGPTWFGHVLSVNHITPSDLSVDLAAQVNAISGWLAHANTTASAASDSTGYKESAQTGSTLVMTPGGVHMQPTVGFTSATSGQLGSQLIDQNYGGVPALAAKTAFTLNAGTNGTVTVTAPATQGGTGTAALTNGAVNFITNLVTTAAAVATAINNYTFITGYSAISNGATVTVFAPSTWGNVTFNLTVTTTGDITTAAGTPSSLFTMTLSPLGLDVVKVSSSGGTVVGSISASSSGASGTVGVTFKWEETDATGTPIVGASPSGILMSPLAIGTVGPPFQAAATVTFSKSFVSANSAFGHFKCTATDNGANAQTNTPYLLFTVALELANHQ